MRSRGRLGALLLAASLTAAAHPFDPFAQERQAHLRAVAEPLRRGDALEALDRAERASALFAKHATFHVLRAQILLKLGRVPDARGAVEQAIAIAPDEPMAYWLRGVIHQLQGHPAHALADFDRVLRTDDLDGALKAQAIGSRGMALADLGHDAQALRELDRALALRPAALAERQFRAATLLRLGRAAARASVRAVHEAKTP